LPRPFSSDPRYLVLHPDGKRLFMASRGSNAIAVVDVATMKVVKKFPGAKDTGLVGLTADGKLLYGVDRDAPAAVVIETQSGKVVATVPVGKKPFGLAVRPVGRVDHAERSVRLDRWCGGFRARSGHRRCTN